MEDLVRKLGFRTNATIFLWSAGLTIVLLGLILVFTDPVNSAFTEGRAWVVSNLGWFFVLGVTVWLVFLIWVAVSRYGNLRLGAPDDRPQYSNLSWFAMLFAGGIGTVLMFWGVAEPISHFSAPPFEGVQPYTPEAAEEAMTISLYHLSLHTWAIFTLPGLAFGFFIYRYNLPLRVSSVFYPVLKDKIHGPIGRTIDIFAVLGTVFGIAVSLGLGTSQISAGISNLTNWEDGTTLKVAIIAILIGAATVSIVAGLDKGIKRLSNINILMAVGIMVFVFIFSDSLFLARQVFESLGEYLGQIVPLSLWNDAMAEFTKDGGWSWQGSWTVFYWAWTVTWAPFMGVFLARISRGRTLRQFVVGVLGAPSLFTLIWFVIFGWSAMELDGLNGEQGTIAQAVEQSGAGIAMFTFFESFPLTTLLQGLAIVVVGLFLITSADSAALVVDMLGSGEPDGSPVRQRIFWGLGIGVVAAALTFLGGGDGIEALQQVITVIGLPIFILVFLMIPALVIGLRMEREKVMPMTHHQFLELYGDKLEPETRGSTASGLVPEHAPKQGRSAADAPEPPPAK